jgi:hypothetical protein
MTVRLLVPAYGKQTNALYTGTLAAERALIDAGQADNNLSSSFDYADYLAGKSMAAVVPGLSAAAIDAAGGDLTARAATGPVLYNPRGLRRWRAAYDGCLFAPAHISVEGDSIADGVGATGNATQNTDNVAADLKGWPGQLRARLAAKFGVAQAGLIAPRNGSTVDPDARVARSGGASISTTGPMWGGWGISGNNGPASAAASITFTLPRCTAFDILTFQSTASPLTGAFTYAVDGGAAVPIANTGNGYVAYPVTGLSDATHTVVLTGVSVSRFTRAGWTLLDSFGLGSNADSSASAPALERLASSYGAWAPHLSIIGFLHNDWALQLTANPSGIFSTPENYETYLRNAVARAVAPGVGSVLLLAPQVAPTQTVPSGRPITDYHAVMKKIALDTDHVAHLNVNEKVGSVAQALDVGFHYNGTTVHPSVRGYGMMASLLDATLTRPDIIGLSS